MTNFFLRKYRFFRKTEYRKEINLKENYIMGQKHLKIYKKYGHNEIIIVPNLPLEQRIEFILNLCD